MVGGEFMDQNEMVLRCCKRDKVPCYEDGGTGKFHFCVMASEPRNLAECLERFEKAKKWYLGFAHRLDEKTKFLSFVDENWPDLQKIVSMEEKVLILLLHEIADGANPIWRFTAIRRIAQCSDITIPPVPEEDRGYVEKIKEQLLVWGKENGYY